MSIHICGRCHHSFGINNILDGTHGETVDGVWVCWNCSRAIRNEKSNANRERERREREQHYQEEERRKQERIRRQQEEEDHEEFLREQERQHQELLAQQERHHQELLDATLPWHNCAHCGKKERQDRVVENSGNKYCESCGYKLKTCKNCKKTFVFEKYREVFTKQEGVMYSRKIIKSGDLTNNDTGENIGDYYNEFWKQNLVICDSCYNTSRATEKKLWDNSDAFKIEYEKLKKAKEKADEAERVRQQIAQEADRRFAEEQEKRRRVAEDKKLVKNRFTPIISFFIAFFVFLNIWFLADLSFVASAVIGVAVGIAAYFVIRPIIYGREKGFFFGTGLGTFAGLLPGLFIYWTLEWSFILSWTISFIVITLFCVCLEALGLLDGFLDLLDRLS